MSGRGIALFVLGGFWSVVTWSLWRAIVSPLLWQSQKFPEDQAPTEVPTLAIVPRIPDYVRESDIPRVPPYLVGPFIFVDGRLGIAMLAGWPVVIAGHVPRDAPIDPWIFRVHGDHWCTVRKATLNDLETIENLRRYSRPLLLMRAQ